MARAAGLMAIVALVGTGAQSAAAAPAVVSCADAVESGDSRPAIDPSWDVTIGPLTFLSARRTPGRRRGAFGGEGYKLPLAMTPGTVAVVSVPVRWRRSVRLIYSLKVQRRVHERGIRAGSKALRFEACPASAEVTSTGWAGGIVTRRRVCAALEVRIVGQPGATVGRVPLGRRCPRQEIEEEPPPV